MEFVENERNVEHIREAIIDNVHFRIGRLHIYKEPYIAGTVEYVGKPTSKNLVLLNAGHALYSTMIKRIETVLNENANWLREKYDKRDRQ